MPYVVAVMVGASGRLHHADRLPDEPDGLRPGRLSLVTISSVSACRSASWSASATDADRAARLAILRSRSGLASPARSRVGGQPRHGMRHMRIIQPFHPADPGGVMLIPVILSGGSGTRLWPLSRELYPKQLLPLVGRANDAAGDRCAREPACRIWRRRSSSATRIIASWWPSSCASSGTAPQAIVLEPQSVATPRRRRPSPHCSRRAARDADPDPCCWCCLQTT